MKAAEAKVGTKVLYLDTQNGQILKGVIKSDLILAPPGLCVILDLEEPGRGDAAALQNGRQKAHDFSRRDE